MIVLLGRDERVIDLLINAEYEAVIKDDKLLCGDSDEDAETLGDKDGDSDRKGLDDSQVLPDEDMVSSTDWDIDTWLDRVCFGE